MTVGIEDPRRVPERLARFLVSLRDDAPETGPSMLLTSQSVPDLFETPAEPLREALRQCIDRALVEIMPDPDRRGDVEASPAAFGVALALHNCLVAASREKETANADFTAKVVAAIPVARTRDEALAYHAVLRAADAKLRNVGRTDAVAQGLIERSPLTALWMLDVHLPSALQTVARRLLPWWKSPTAQETCWRDDDWFAVVSDVLQDASIARWLRHRWLSVPETRSACRNLGLLLEGLRLREGHRDTILEFYESYDQLTGERGRQASEGRARRWPVLRLAESLLRVSGEDEAAIRLNRRGNEYWMKFRALVEIVIAERGVPRDFRLLTVEFVKALRPLADLATTTTGAAVSFGDVRFEGGS